jgi:hypothetical protein
VASPTTSPTLLLEEPDAAGAESRSPRAATVLTGRLRIAWFVGLGVFAVQLILLLLHSVYLWDHFDLTADFGQYSQAWQQVATGHLDPYTTAYAWHYPHYGYSFYQSDFELAIWPLSLLYWVWPHAIDLLVVQDLALAGAGLVAYRWALEHLEQHASNKRFALGIGAAVLVVLVAQPWTYWAASFDFHSEPLPAFFVVLAGRDLWAGRRRGWIWVAAALVCTNVAASFVIALGIAALISGRTRWRLGLGLVAAGVAWLVVVGLVHAGKGAVLANYAYLDRKTTVNDSVGGIVTIGSGLVFHPGIAAHVIRTRFGALYKFVGGAGSIGVFSAVGAAFSAVVLLPSVLNASPAFISDVGGAQNILVPIACAVGIAMLATWLAERGRALEGRWRVGLSALALVLAVGAAAETVGMSAYWTPKSGEMFARVDSATAAQLAKVSTVIPGDAETIVSQGVVGRFAQRHAFYPYIDAFGDGQTVPLFGRTVYVVLLPTQGLESATPAATEAAIAQMRRLGARQLSARDGVYAFAWRVPRGQHTVTFPPP